MSQVVNKCVVATFSGNNLLAYFASTVTLLDDVEVPSFLDTKLLLEADTRLLLSDMPGLKLLLLTRECKCMALV